MHTNEERDIARNIADACREMNEIQAGRMHSEPWEVLEEKMLQWERQMASDQKENAV